MSAHNKANELARAILESSEYRELEKAKRAIDSKREYVDIVKGIKKKQAEVQMSITSSKGPDKSKLDYLSKIYEESFKVSDIKRYFEAEKSFNEYAARIFKVINDAIYSALK